jgi:hypothetical protein
VIAEMYAEDTPLSASLGSAGGLEKISKVK